LYIFVQKNGYYNFKIGVIGVLRAYFLYLMPNYDEWIPQIAPFRSSGNYMQQQDFMG